MHILVVEDEEVISLALRLELEAIGIDVDVHGTASQALPAIETTQYDAAVIDIGLPDVRGDELARTARDRHSHLPIILATGMRSEEISTPIVDDSLVQVLEKPFQTYELLGALRRLGVSIDVSQPSKELAI